MFWGFFRTRLYATAMPANHYELQNFSSFIEYWPFISVAWNILLSASPGHQQLQLALLPFILLCFQPSLVNDLGILLWSKLSLCTHIQELCCQWLILLGLSSQRLCDKFQCSPELLEKVQVGIPFCCCVPFLSLMKDWSQLRLEAWRRSFQLSWLQHTGGVLWEIPIPGIPSALCGCCCGHQQWPLMICWARSERHSTDNAVALLVPSFSAAWFYSSSLNRAIL